MPARHLIGRLTVEIALSGPGQAPARQQEISAWARADDLWRNLSLALDQLVPPGEVLTIPRLELTIEASSEPAFRAQLHRALTQAVGQLLRHPAPATVRRPLAQYTQELAWHFLVTGTLPWTAPREQAAAVAALLNGLPEAENEAFVRHLRPASAANPVLWQRLVYTIGLEKARRLVLRHGRFSPPQAAELLQAAAVAEQQGGAASAFWHNVFINNNLTNTPPPAFQQAVQVAAQAAGRFPAPITPPPSPDPEGITATGQPAGNEPPAATYFVPHAGLVLLSQFLPQLFKRLSLLAANNFIDDEARHKAIHLLHYLATGETEAYEYDLLLPKLLCHHPLARPVPRWVPLPPADLAEANALLAAAIQHWRVLRNTSAAGLRETFLRRPGQLSAAPMGGWRLHVERKTVDILLDRLPVGWGYAVVSLPWLPELLFVEW